MVTLITGAKKCNRVIQRDKMGISENCQEKKRVMILTRVSSTKTLWHLDKSLTHNPRHWAAQQGTWNIITHKLKTSTTRNVSHYHLPLSSIKAEYKVTYLVALSRNVPFTLLPNLSITVSLSLVTSVSLKLSAISANIAGTHRPTTARSKFGFH